MTSADTWAVIGALGIKPTYNQYTKKWEFSWTDESSGKQFWSESESIKMAAFFFVDKFLKG